MSSNNNNFINNISGIILAGGKSSRMGEDKALKKINHATLIEYTIQNIQHQVKSITINTNQNFPNYQKLGYPLISDIDPDLLGPLSGIFSALQKISTDWAFISACDTPYLPKNIVSRLFLHAQHQNKRIAVVETNKKLQPLVLLLHKDLTVNLKTFISSGERKTQTWVMQQHPAVLDCSDESAAFTNINNAQDFLQFKNNLLNDK